MLKSILEDVTFLQLFLWISAALFLLSLVRIYRLGRENRRMSQDHTKMEKWAVTQQAELVSVHHDAQSWRAKTQRQFDAVRADMSARLEQAERGNQHAQRLVDSAQENALMAAMARISELETKLQAAEAEVVVPEPFIPALPAMETLQLQSMESELATVRAEASAQRQQNAELQRALLLARRKQPVPRRNGSRMPRHG